VAICTVEYYAEPDQIEAAHHGASARWQPTQRGRQTAELVRTRFDKLWLGRFNESGARISHTPGIPTRSFIKFPLRTESELIIDGRPVPAGAVVRHAQADEYTERTTGRMDWALLSLPVEDMIAAGLALSGHELRPPSNALFVTPAPERMTRLRSLHDAGASLAKYAPHVLAHPEAARALEHSIIEALVGCLTDDETTREKWARRARPTVMRRFQQVLEENIEDPVYVPEICKMIGVPERVLRRTCQHYLDMSPKQYLTLRRMQLARKALQSPDVRGTSVTETATRFGFWQLGRFSVAYRSIFGESPSATLRRSQAGL